VSLANVVARVARACVLRVVTAAGSSSLRRRPIDSSSKLSIPPASSLYSASDGSQLGCSESPFSSTQTRQRKSENTESAQVAAQTNFRALASKVAGIPIAVEIYSIEVSS